LSLTPPQSCSYKAIQPNANAADSAVAALAVAADESDAIALSEPKKQFPYEAQRTAERLVDAASKHGLKLVDEDQRERQVMRMAGECVRGRLVAENMINDIKADGVQAGYKSWGKLRQLLQMNIDAVVQGDDKATATAPWRVCRGWYDPPVAGLDIPPDGGTAYSIDDRELAASCQKAGWSVVGLDVEAPTETANDITFHYLDGTSETHGFITFCEAVKQPHIGEVIEVFA
tara:strand:- start:1503 stop:2195 length:693 start_codon:yes stop_codon:yes gene_type:complete